MNLKTAAFTVLLPLLSAPALAGVCQGAYEDDLSKARLAQVTRKTPLYHDTCQKTGSCGSGGYLVAGDLVVVTGTQGKWACVMYTSQKGRAFWHRAMPVNALKNVTLPSDPRGTWRVEDQSLLFRRSGDRLLVRGWTAWPWSSSPDPADQERLKNSGPNIGNVDFSAAWQQGANTAEFSSGPEETACRLKVRVLGPYLFASDNNQCGGMNASFSGVYRQTSPTVSDKAWQDAKAP